jgi:hypothetical protein
VITFGAGAVGGSIGSGTPFGISRAEEVSPPHSLSRTDLHHMARSKVPRKPAGDDLARLDHPKIGVQEDDGDGEAHPEGVDGAGTLEQHAAPGLDPVAPPQAASPLAGGPRHMNAERPEGRGLHADDATQTLRRSESVVCGGGKRERRAVVT